MESSQDQNYVGAIVAWFDRLCLWHTKYKWYCRTIWVLVLVPPVGVAWFHLTGHDTVFRHWFYLPFGGV